MLKNSVNLKEEDKKIEEIVRGLEKCFQKLVENKRQQHSSLVVLKNGQITNIQEVTSEIHYSKSVFKR
ncbi:MAG: hypothetical protein LBR36_00605 [Bacteroidales bacterium]|jgi:hypothetical protein|nr:hypothetical protein [Bacteroidales bacterium]